MSLSKKFDDSLICHCVSNNRNKNVILNEADTSTSDIQLFPHIKKIYDCETNSLEQVHIIMSTIRPDQKHEEKVVYGRRHRTRVSKQKAKLLITECCSKRLPEPNKSKPNEVSSTSFPKHDYQ